MSTDTEIANAANPLIDCKYGQGLDCTKDGKFDCVTAIFKFYEALGVKLPTEFEGITLEHYLDIWNTDIKKAKEILSRYFLSLGQPVEYNKIVRGDLLLYKSRAMILFPAIYLGNGNAFFIFQEGGRVCPTSQFKSLFAEARRLLNV